jgi:hypothetical protein
MCTPTHRHHIAILDILHQDTGLKLLFPDADYFSFCHNPAVAGKYPDVLPSLDIEKFATNTATDAAYTHIFIIAPLYNCRLEYNTKNPQFSHDLYNYFCVTIDILRGAAAPKIAWFDTHEYNYDPNQIIAPDIAAKSVFFKRNYANNIVYRANVVPFPYVGSCGQSGEVAIDIITRAAAADTLPSPWATDDPNPEPGGFNRLFYVGALKSHHNPVYGAHTDEIEMMQRIKGTVGEYLIYREKMPDCGAYQIELARSWFCLYLCEKGNAPSGRIFDILASGSILLRQCPLRGEGAFVWGAAPDGKVVGWDTENQLYECLNALGENKKTYEMCREQQRDLVTKYMSKTALCDFILHIVT